VVLRGALELLERRRGRPAVPLDEDADGLTDLLVDCGLDDAATREVDRIRTFKRNRA